MQLDQNQNVGKHSTCLNCQTEFHGHFCPECGQASSVHRITFKETLTQFFSFAFSLQGPLLFTAWSLVLRPGSVYRAFIAGQRKKYYNPISLFVLVTAVYLITRSLIGFDPLQGQAAQVQQVGMPEVAIQMINSAKFMIQHINNILLIPVICLALMLKLFFRKRYNLAEYTAVSFYIVAMYILVGIIYMLVIQLSPLSNMKPQLILLFVIILFSVLSLFQDRRIGVILKCILLSLLSVYLYVSIAFGLSYLIISVHWY